MRTRPLRKAFGALAGVAVLAAVVVSLDSLYPLPQREFPCDQGLAVQELRRCEGDQRRTEAAIGDWWRNVLLGL